VDSSMIWREMINKSCLIGYCANIKKDVAGGQWFYKSNWTPDRPKAW